MPRSGNHFTDMNMKRFETIFHQYVRITSAAHYLNMRHGNVIYKIENVAQL